jgi:hypothetical protein
MVEKKKTCCGGWHWSMKIFFGLIFIVVIFVISACVVLKRDYRESRMMKNYGYTVMQNYKLNSGCNQDGPKTMVRFGDNKLVEKVEMVRLFGIVNKVEGNLITVTTNAAKDQVVVSASDTVIMVGEKEVGLATLKEGDNAIFFGSMNKDSQLEAKVIKVQ